MSLIGGYFCRRGAWPDETVRAKLRSFAALDNDRLDEYAHIVVPFRLGHIVARYKPNAPTQIKAADAEDRSILTLGFHDFDDTAIESGVLKQIKTSEGEFVSLVLDCGDDPAIHIINDRFGARPMYWLHIDDLTAFSSNLLFLIYLLDLDSKADVLGWLQIFSYSHTLGDRTNTKGIRRLTPASHLTISRTGADCRPYWHLCHRSAYDLDPAEHAERTFEAMRRSTAARARLSDAGFVTLSGGLDSRLVAGTLPDESDFYLYTFSAAGNDADVAAARQVAERLRRRHRVEPLSQEHISAVAQDAVRLTAGLTTIQHPAKTFQNLREMIAGPRFKLGGGPGDVLAGSYTSGSIFNVLPAMKDRQLYKYIFHRKRFSAKDLARVWRREIVQAHYAELDEQMSHCFGSLSGETAAQCISAWAMVFRQPAFTFTSPIHNHPDITEASPHLGYDYADRMLELPAEWIYKKNFYRFMIRHCMPQLADVVYANTGRPLPLELRRYDVPPRKKLSAAVERLLPARLLETHRRPQLCRPMPHWNIRCCATTESFCSIPGRCFTASGSLAICSTSGVAMSSSMRLKADLMSLLAQVPQFRG